MIFYHFRICNGIPLKAMQDTSSLYNEFSIKGKIVVHALDSSAMKMLFIILIIFTACGSGNAIGYCGIVCVLPTE